MARKARFEKGGAKPTTTPHGGATAAGGIQIPVEPVRERIPSYDEIRPEGYEHVAGPPAAGARSGGVRAGNYGESADRAIEAYEEIRPEGYAETAADARGLLTAKEAAVLLGTGFDLADPLDDEVVESIRRMAVDAAAALP